MGSSLSDRYALEAANGARVKQGPGLRCLAPELEKGSAQLVTAASKKYALLSPRERAVLVAAALGAEDKEIAADLGCSISTVRTLWQRTYRKTQEPSRRRLVALIWEEAYRLASVSIIR